MPTLLTFLYVKLTQTSHFLLGRPLSAGVLAIAPEKCFNIHENLNENEMSMWRVGLERRESNTTFSIYETPNLVLIPSE